MLVSQSNPYGVLVKDRLEEFEVKLGRLIPAELRRYLMDHNGPFLEKDIFSIPNEGESQIHYLYGLHDGPEYTRLDKRFDEIDESLKKKFIPLGADETGNELLLSIRDHDSGSVWFLDHETRSLLKLAETLSQFFSSLTDVVQYDNEVDQAIHDENLDYFNNAISCGMDINELDEDGWSVLDYALLNQKKRLINFLLSKGADSTHALEIAKDYSEEYPDYIEFIEIISASSKQ